MTITYNLNESQGMFLDSISHALGTQGRLKLSKHVESTGALDLGRITTRGVSNDIDLTRGGVRTGLRYGREWSRLQFGFSGSAGYSEEHFDALPRRQLTYLGGSLDGRYGLTSKDDIFWEVWTRVNDNDAIGVGFTYSEDRASLGWERRFERHWRLKNSVYTRRSTYDTFQFGVQESDEVGLTGTLENSVGGLNYSISSTEGISDFIPDPGTSGRFLPGTDLVNKTDMATLGTHWRIGSWVTIQGQVRREHRSFTTIGVEDITSYQAEARFQRNTWTVSTRYSSYERADGLMFVDDTWMLRISKLFY